MSLLFRQERVGLNGQPFTILKFETMRDGQVTRPLLRRTGLDELPQVWNILRGDMNLIGPRPEMPHVHEQLSQRLGEVWDMRLRVKPGLISLASVCLHEARGPDRYDLWVKAEQAILDNTMIDTPGLRVRLEMIRRVPKALLKGQTT